MTAIRHTVWYGTKMNVNERKYGEYQSSLLSRAGLCYKEKWLPLRKNKFAATGKTDCRYGENRLPLQEKRETNNGSSCTNKVQESNPHFCLCLKGYDFPQKIRSFIQ